MLELKLYYDGVNYDVDLTGTDSIPLNYTVQDIRNPEGRNSSFSKSITIAGTNHNNRIFKFLFEIGGESDWNVNKKVRCAVYQEGSLIFDGFIRVKNIIRNVLGVNNYDLIAYECDVFGSLIDFAKDLGTTRLQDLAWSDLDHTYNRTNVEASWTAGVGALIDASPSVSAAPNGLTILGIASHSLSIGDYVFLEHSGNISHDMEGVYQVLDIQGGTDVYINCPYNAGFAGPSWSVYEWSWSGLGYYYPMIDFGNNFGNTWKVTDFYPAVYVKQYIDRIFDSAGWQYDSDFFNTEFFKSLIIPFNGTEIAISGEDINDSLARAALSADSVSFLSQNLGSGPLYSNNAVATLVFDDDSNPPNYDNNANYNAGTGDYTAPFTAYYNVGGRITGVVTLSANPYATGYSPQFLPQARFTVRVNGVAQAVYVADVIFDTGTGVGTFDIEINSPLPLLANTGDVIDFRLGVQFNTQFTQNGIGVYTGALTATTDLDAGSFFVVTIQNQQLLEGGPLTMANAIPKDIKAIDFFAWVCRLFNLMVDEDKNESKLLRIEPWINYYNNSAAALDWTSKLATDKDITIIPMGELQAKEYLFQYTDDKDVFNEDHLKVWGEQYGRKQTIVDNDFVTGVQTVQTGFSPTVLHDFPVGSDRVISTIQGNGTITNNRIASNLRILIANPLGTSQTYNVQSLGVNYPTNLFAYAGHLDNPRYPLADLNYSSPKGVYYPYTAWTDANLYNTYWKAYTEEIVGRYSKIITAYFHLNQADIATLDFRNLIRVDNHLFRLNKIIDYNPITNDLTLVELLKVQTVGRFIPTSAGGGGGYIPTPDDELTFEDRPPRGSGTIKPDLNRFVNENINYKMGDNEGSMVRGADNYLGYGAKNCTVIGNGNYIFDGVSNVTIIGTDNITVAVSNTVVIGGQVISGAVFQKVTRKTTSQALDAQDSYTEADASGGNITFTLPAPASVVGQEFTIKRVDGSANTVTIDVEDATNIDGNPTYSIINQYDSRTFHSTGIDYTIV